MDNVEVYGFEDADGTESGFTTRDIEEARRYARSNNLKLIAYIFEFAATELVEDNTKKKGRRR